jgi:hypothetical protein
VTDSAPGLVIYRVSSGKEAALLAPLKDRCGGLVISGHTGAYFRSSVTGLIRTMDLPFFVDPSVWLLARDSDRIRKDDGQLRNSIDRYVDQLGDEVDRIVRKGGRSLKASDFFDGTSWNNKLIDEIIKGSVAGQEDFVDPTRQRTLDELLDLAGGDAPHGKTYAPAFVVAPYFFGENVADLWYKVTVELLKRTIARKSPHPVYGVICVPKDILDDKTERETLVRDFAQATGVFIWISEFHDSGRESEATVRGYLSLVRALIQKGRPVYVLYGGYPSLLLMKLGLKGICHGLCYGDSKSVYQIPSTGPPPSRFYLTFSKTKVPLVEAQALYASKPRRPCSCSECAAFGSNRTKWSQLEVNAFFRRLRSDEALPKHHFATCRWEEARAVSRRSLDTLLSDWDQLWTENSALDPGSIDVRRTALDLWRKVLTEPVNP